MSFFQNVFLEEFRGNWVIGDRQYSIAFSCPANKGRGYHVVCAWENGPYDLTGTDSNGTVDRENLTISFALSSSDLFKDWHDITVDIGGTVLGATTPQEIRDALNADATFSTYFQAYLEEKDDFRLHIHTLSRNSNIKFYVKNEGAEEILRFNRYAGIAELPSYFERHSIEQRHDFPDANNCLITLSKPISSITLANPTVITSTNHGLTTGDLIYIRQSNSDPVVDGDNRVVTVVNEDTFTVPVNVTTAGTSAVWARANDFQIIANAVSRQNMSLGFSLATAQWDWQLLRGRTGLFNFQIANLNGDGTVNWRKEFPAGAQAGDFGKITHYDYDGANPTPINVWEVPYQVTQDDVDEVPP